MRLVTFVIDFRRPGDPMWTEWAAGTCAVERTGDSGTAAEIADTYGARTSSAAPTVRVRVWNDARSPLTEVEATPPDDCWQVAS